MEDSTKIKAEKETRVSDVLKRKTLDVHRVVESTGFMKDLLSPSLIIESYTKILVRILGALLPIESSLARSSYLREFSSVIDRVSIAKLQQDIAVLSRGFAPPKVIQEPFSPCPSIGATAGVLYVLEGSANGGRVFYQFLSNRLGLTEDAGLSYFAMQASTAGLRFSAFKEELNKKLNANDLEPAVDFAKLTFRRFAP